MIGKSHIKKWGLVAVVVLVLLFGNFGAARPYVFPLGAFEPTPAHASAPTALSFPNTLRNLFADVGPALPGEIGQTALKPGPKGPAAEERDLPGGPKKAAAAAHIHPAGEIAPTALKGPGRLAGPVHPEKEPLAAELKNPGLPAEPVEPVPGDLSAIPELPGLAADPAAPADDNLPSAPTEPGILTEPVDPAAEVTPPAA